MNWLELKETITAPMKEAMLEGVKQGCICPLCSQHAKIYKRKMTGAAAANLINLAKLTEQHGTTYYHYTEFCNKGLHGDFGKLANWGLVECKPNTLDHKKSSGFWRITPKGMDFAFGVGTVQKYCLIYNKRCLGFEGEQVDIKDCLGDDFNYKELMNDKASWTPAKFWALWRKN